MSAACKCSFLLTRDEALEFDEGEALQLNTSLLRQSGGDIAGSFFSPKPSSAGGEDRCLSLSLLANWATVVFFFVVKKGELSHKLDVQYYCFH